MQLLCVLLEDLSHNGHGILLFNVDLCIYCDVVFFLIHPYYQLDNYYLYIPIHLTYVKYNTIAPIPGNAKWYFLIFVKSLNTLIGFYFENKIREQKNLY